MATKMSTRAPWWEFRVLLVQREPFQCYGNLHGLRCDSDYVRAHRGQLPASTVLPGSIDYAVYSYQTPIAWHLAATDEWVCPQIRYSQTTSSHQSRIRTAALTRDVSVQHVIENW